MARFPTRLALGTVQFGLPYGVTNALGQVSGGVVVDILRHAWASGICVLDTAALYGVAETVLGQAMRDAGGEYRVVTKTAKFSDVADSTDDIRSRFETTLASSLRSLQLGSLYGLLAHDVGDLLGARGDLLWEAMEAAKAEGKVQKIGASVYNGREIDCLLDRFLPDLVQLPINVLDRRLVVGGQLDRLARAGVEIHGRSIFLQGLILRDPDMIPPKFGVLAERLKSMTRWAADNDMTIMEVALAGVPRQIHNMVVGVTGVEELRQITEAGTALDGRSDDLDLTRWALDDERLLNPARWNEL